METSAWALVDADNIVLSVQIASQEWIDANPADAPNAWHVSPDNDSPGYAGIGFTWDEPTGWYIPPQPEPGWVFDRDKWEWVDPNAEPESPDTPSE